MIINQLSKIAHQSGRNSKILNRLRFLSKSVLTNDRICKVKNNICYIKLSKGITRYHLSNKIAELSG